MLRYKTETRPGLVAL